MDSRETSGKLQNEWKAHKHVDSLIKQFFLATTISRTHNLTATELIFLHRCLHISSHGTNSFRRLGLPPPPFQ